MEASKMSERGAEVFLQGAHIARTAHQKRVIVWATQYIHPMPQSSDLCADNNHCASAATPATRILGRNQTYRLKKCIYSKICVPPANEGQSDVACL